jgi:hypothetical protein
MFIKAGRTPRRRLAWRNSSVTRRSFPQSRLSVGSVDDDTWRLIWEMAGIQA